VDKLRHDANFLFVARNHDRDPVQEARDSPARDDARCVHMRED
jgi:hypothetical protein